MTQTKVSKSNQSAEDFTEMVSHWMTWKNLHEDRKKVLEDLAVSETVFALLKNEKGETGVFLNGEPKQIVAMLGSASMAPNHIGVLIRQSFFVGLEGFIDMVSEDEDE